MEAGRGHLKAPPNGTARALRKIVVGMGGTANGYLREDG